jgi:hypothetical protein
VAIRATRRVSHNDHPPRQHAVADDSHFTALLSSVFDLKGDALKDHLGIREVQAPFRQRLLALDRIEGDTRSVIVATITGGCTLSTARLDADTLRAGSKSPWVARSREGLLVLK